MLYAHPTIRGITTRARANALNLDAAMGAVWVHAQCQIRKGVMKRLKTRTAVCVDVSSNVKGLPALQLQPQHRQRQQRTATPNLTAPLQTTKLRYVCTWQ